MSRSEMMTKLLIMTSLASSAYLPDFTARDDSNHKSLEALHECPKCGKVYTKYVPRYCEDCKKRLIVEEGYYDKHSQSTTSK